MKLRQIGHSFAREAIGLDISKELANNEIASLRKALGNHGVLVLREQGNASYDDLRRLANQLGQASECSDITNINREGQILDPDALESRYNRANSLWHVDMILLESPPLLAMLSSRELPTSGTGRTDFSDLSLAWKRLPLRLRRMLLGARAVHSIETIRRRIGITEPEELANDYKPASHPLVAKEPFSSSPVLFVSGHTSHIEGLPREDSDAIIEKIFQGLSDEGFYYSHEWRLHDLVIWNNRRVAHRVGSYNVGGERRRLWRMEVVGDKKPVAYRPNFLKRIWG